MCIIYRKYTLLFVPGIQHVFLGEVSHRYYSQGVFCIPGLRLGHKKNFGHNSYISCVDQSYILKDTKLFKFDLSWAANTA